MTVRGEDGTARVTRPVGDLFDHAVKLGCLDFLTGKMATGTIQSDDLAGIVSDVWTLAGPYMRTSDSESPPAKPEA